MNAHRAAGILLMLVFAVRCGGGGSSPVDPPDPLPVTQVIPTDPVEGLTIHQGQMILCDQDAQIIPADPRAELFLQWWLKGENEWAKARGDSVLTICETAPFGSPEPEGSTILKWAGNSPATPPPGDYIVTVHVRPWPNGGIRGSAHRTLHVIP